jgi:hypothetical protein
MKAINVSNPLILIKGGSVTAINQSSELWHVNTVLTGKEVNRMYFDS